MQDTKVSFLVLSTPKCRFCLDQQLN